MTLKVAINGVGRIGRNLMRAYFETLARNDGAARQFELVAVNDLGSAESLAHLLRYDTTHGPFRGEVAVRAASGDVGEALVINGTPVALSHGATPQECPWAAHDIDVVLECTGVFRARADAAKHRAAGAKRVVIGAVSFDAVDNTVVYGVNHESLQPDQLIISNASCTTHCLAPLLSLLDGQWGVRSALMTEIHAYTSDQALLDRTHRDLRRARAGAQNLIPTTSSSIGAVQHVLPQMAGRIDGYSMRVPTINVAALDLTVQLERPCSVDELHDFMRASAERGQGLLGYCDEPLVSSDFIQRTESAIFDATQTKRIGDLLKMTAWYDNEWGYIHRLMDLLDYMSTR